MITENDIVARVTVNRVTFVATNDDVVADVAGDDVGTAKVLDNRFNALNRVGRLNTARTVVLRDHAVVAQDDVVAVVTEQVVYARQSTNRYREHSVNGSKSFRCSRIKCCILILRKQREIHIERRVTVNVVVTLLTVDPVYARTPGQLIIILATSDRVIAGSAVDGDPSEVVIVLRHATRVDDVIARIVEVGAIDRGSCLIIAVANAIL